MNSAFFMQNEPIYDVSDRIPRLRVFDLKSLENKNL